MGGFTIRTTSRTEHSHVAPLYDISSSFWENYEKGPRALTEAERADLAGLRKRIESLQGETGKTLETTLFGRRIPNPVGIASGPAPNFKWLEFFADLGYGILTYKTMRDRSWKGHGMPNILNVNGDFRKGFVVADEVTGSITNSLGMPTPEPDVWKREARRVARMKGSRFFVMSVTATPQKGTEEEVLSQFGELALAGKAAGADAVELNLSCPNVLPGEGGETFANPKLSGKIVDAVRSRVGSQLPILVKAGYLEEYGEFVDETYDDMLAYVVINSVPGVVRDASGATLFADRGGRAGVCGAAIREKARAAVRKLSSLRRGKRDFEVIGLGGVLGAWDALALIDRGAGAVETATGALLDPSLGLRISLGLLRGMTGERKRS